MNDIVYMLKDPLPDNGVELGYSLRSLKHMPHGRVFMVTPRLPDWINPDTVEHISHLPVHENRKWDDLGEKWKWLGTNDVMTDEVIYMDDDYFIIRPVKQAGPRPAFHPLWVLIKYYTEEYGDVEIVRAFINAERLIKEHGVEVPLHPLQHYPWPVVRSNIPVHWEDGKGPYDWKILEFNHNNPNPPEYHHENKVTNREDLQRVVARGTPYVSSADDGSFVDSGLLSLLEQMFPEKSEYERD